MKLFVFLILGLALQSVAEERAVNPCFSPEVGYDEQHCEICLESSKKLAEEECREESKFADEIFSDVIYADSDEYAGIYKEWRTRIKARDLCRIDLLIQCLESPVASPR